MKKTIVLSLSAFAMLYFSGCSKHSETVGVNIKKFEKPSEAQVLYSEITEPTMKNGVLTATVVNTIDVPEYATIHNIVSETDCTFKHFLDSHRNKLSVCETTSSEVEKETVNEGVVNRTTVSSKQPVVYISFGKPLNNGVEDVEKVEILGDNKGVVSFDIKPLLYFTESFDENLSFSIYINESDKEFFQGELSVDEITKLKAMYIPEVVVEDEPVIDETEEAVIDGEDNATITE